MTPCYRPPVDQFLNLGRPKSRDFDYQSLGITAEHIPDLLRMVADEEFHTAPSDSNLVWAPVHAWRALAALRADQAVGPLLGLLRRIDEHNDDWVGDDVPRVLGTIGPAALEPVTAYLANPANHEWARIAASTALGEIGKQHAELRGECVSRLSAQLERFAEQSEALNALLVSPLLDLNAREALPVMERAFAAGRVDETAVGDFEDVEIELGLKAQRQHPPKPSRFPQLGDDLRAFMAASANRGPFLNDTDAMEPPQPFVRDEKIGRNDPCPCGSGKKYKKCCVKN